MRHNLFYSLQTFDPCAVSFYSPPRPEEEGVGPAYGLPVCVRITPESLPRNCGGRRVKGGNARAYAARRPRGVRAMEVPFR